MSTLALVHKTDFQKHLTPEAHPETPVRLAAIDEALHRSELAAALPTLEPRLARLEELTSVHKSSYIEQIAQNAEVCQELGGLFKLDPDTYMSAHSFDIALLAAGAGLEAISAVFSRSHERAFVLARPPGHHALTDKPMGFCLFNNISVAARQAQLAFGKNRVLIVDWDVHHGNGTQEIFYDDPSVCFISFQQWPQWPFTGWYTEDGTGEGKGYNINIPLPQGTGDRGYLAAWDAIVDPIAREFEPEIILLSAGYDAHQGDPLGQQQLSTRGYFLLSARLCDLAEAIDCPLVGFLEGGYNIRSLADSVVATLLTMNKQGMNARNELKAFGGIYGGEVGAATNDRNTQLVDGRINDIRRHFSHYWKNLR